MGPKSFYKILFVILLFFVLDRAIFHFLHSGLVKFYGMDKGAEIVFIGHSHTLLGIDSEKIGNELDLHTSKYAFAGSNVFDRYHMVKQLVDKEPSLKTVVYDVDPRLFDIEGLSSASYTLLFPFIENQEIARYLKQKATWQEFYINRFIKTSRFRDQTLLMAFYGLANKTEGAKTSQVVLKNYKNYLNQERERKIVVNQEGVNIFLETIQYLELKKIRTVLVFLPVIDKLNEIDRSTQEDVLSIFHETAEENRNVFYLNYNDAYEHEHEMFYDLRHLNEQGKQEVTKRLIQDLHKIIDQ
jgi:hypothetical protein